MRARRHKFGAIATHVCAGCFVWGDGVTCIACKGAEFIRFDSKAEAKRFATLCLMQKAGAIRNLVRQQVYPVSIKGIHICNYVADFVYHRGGTVVTEDVKGAVTAEFKLKRKLVEAQYGVKIEVIPA